MKQTSLVKSLAWSNSLKTEEDRDRELDIEKRISFHLLAIRTILRFFYRFSHGAHMVFLIGSMTDYYSFKPSDVEPLMPREAKAA